MKPTIGSIVHYYPSSHDDPAQWNAGAVGDPIAAVVVRVWTGVCVNLRLLTDSGDMPWKTSICFDEDHVEASWDWPPREVAKVPEPPGSKHFHVSEFRCHDGTDVPVEYYDRTQMLMDQLEVLRAEFGGAAVTIISGYRSLAHNEQVKGKSGSRHLFGEASDIRVKGHSPKGVADTFERLIKEGKILEGGLGRYESFTHYDVRGKRARWGSNS